MSGKNIDSKNSPKLITPLTMLEDAFSEYRGKLQKGDQQLIAASSGETLRNVGEYIRGNISHLDTGKKIFKAMRELIVNRENEIKKAVA